MHTLYRTIVSYSHLKIVICICKPNQKNWKENWNTLTSASQFLEVATFKYASDLKFYSDILHGKSLCDKDKILHENKICLPT